MNRLIASLLLSLLVACAAQAAGAPALSADHGWIRNPPAGATMFAGYAHVVNSGEVPLTLVGARSTAFEFVELHETVDENGIARMRPITEIVLLPGESVDFAPGGKHLMLMQPTGKPRLGDIVVVDLVTADGEPLPIVLKIADQAP